MPDSRPAADTNGYSERVARVETQISTLATQLSAMVPQVQSLAASVERVSDAVAKSHDSLAKDIRRVDETMSAQISRIIDRLGSTGRPNYAALAFAWSVGMAVLLYYVQSETKPVRELIQSIDAQARERDIAIKAEELAMRNEIDRLRLGWRDNRDAIIRLNTIAELRGHAAPVPYPAVPPPNPSTGALP